MRAVTFVVLLCVLVACAEAVEKVPKKRGAAAPKVVAGPARRCPASHTEVAGGFCCPKSHPQLIENECHEPCHEDSDDMVLGSWVGCRERCDGDAASSVNSCTRGALSSERKDHVRTGVPPVAQKSLAEITAPTISSCEKGFVAVARSGPKGARTGGCCPKDMPKLVAGRCYGPCENREEFNLGALVSCRAHCPDGWDQHNNHCSKEHEENQDRGDFPRPSVAPSDRVVVPTPVDESKNKGCGSGYVGASQHYCCPATEPVLKGLLCYARCKTGFEEAGYGCRKHCAAGWSESTLQCGKGATSHRREGYERPPKAAKMRA